MPQIGSYCLLLALALSVYTFAAGIWPFTVTMKDSARRLAGPESRFLAVTAASLALVYAAFHNDFSVAYILHHTNRALPAPYKFAALWSGQEGSLLFWCWLLASLRAGPAPAAQGGYAPGGACLGRHQRGADFLPAAGEFCGASVCAGRQARFRPTATGSIRCCSIRRWSSIRRCSTWATSA